MHIPNLVSEGEDCWKCSRVIQMPVQKLNFRDASVLDVCNPRIEDLGILYVPLQRFITGTMPTVALKKMR